MADGIAADAAFEESRAVAVVSGDASRRDAMSALCCSLCVEFATSKFFLHLPSLFDQSLSTTSACGENGGKKLHQ